VSFFVYDSSACSDGELNSKVARGDIPLCPKCASKLKLTFARVGNGQIIHAIECPKVPGHLQSIFSIANERALWDRMDKLMRGDL